MLNICDIPKISPIGEKTKLLPVEFGWSEGPGTDSE